MIYYRCTRARWRRGNRGPRLEVVDCRQYLDSLGGVAANFSWPSCDHSKLCRALICRGKFAQTIADDCKLRHSNVQLLPMTRAGFVAGFLLLTLLFSGCALLHIPARHHPVEQYVVCMTGPKFIDCGQWSLLDRGFRAKLEKAFDCAQAAMRNGTPFLFREHVFATDSTTYDGLLQRPDGKLMHYHYDERPCGNPYCREKFVAINCTNPRLYEQ